VRLFHPHEERIHACSSLQVVIPKRIYSRPDGVRKRYSNVVGMAVCPRDDFQPPGKLLVRFVRPGRHRRQVTFCPFP
jgi:hypothetical protein